MCQRSLSCLAALALLAGGGSALAQPAMVEVRVKQGATVLQDFTSAGGADVIINLDPVSADTDVQIFDNGTSTSPPTLSVGKVTINGSLDSGAAQLRILVAASGQNFPLVQTVGSLAEGIVNFGSSSTHGLVITDPDLRNNTRLAMAVTGDVNGTIDVGAVFRIQADGVFSGSTHVSGGNINAAITARGRWPRLAERTAACHDLAALGKVVPNFEGRGPRGDRPASLS